MIKHNLKEEELGIEIAHIIKDITYLAVIKSHENYDERSIYCAHHLLAEAMKENLRNKVTDKDYFDNEMSTLDILMDNFVTEGIRKQ